MQCVGPACTSLVHQQKVVIVKQWRELAGVYLGCTDRVFTRATH
jgi:hypothetical protein